MTGTTASAAPAKSRRSAPFGRVAIAIVVAFGAITWSVPSLRDRVFPPTSSAWVTAQRGTYQGHVWQLDVRENDGRFCMSVDGPGGPADVAHGLAGACGFEDKPQDAAFYYASGPGPTIGSYVSYGPLPSNAVAIRVATNMVLPTYRIPHRRGLPRGRYWLQFCSGSCVTSPGAALVVPQPLDANGDAVAFRRF